MSKHTPGPWEVREWTCHAATTIVVADPTVVTGVRVVAECESEEDARLIAAAPELFEALEIAAAALLPYSDEAKLARAALAKATGAAA